MFTAFGRSSTLCAGFVTARLGSYVTEARTDAVHRYILRDFVG